MKKSLPRQSPKKHLKEKKIPKSKESEGPKKVARKAAIKVNSDEELSPVAGGLSRRELGKLRRRRHLLAAARKLFAERGYEKTRPQDIIKAAGVSFGTFYDNFPTKRHCFFAFAEDVVYEVSQVLRWYLPDPGPTPRDMHLFLRGVLQGMFDYSLANPGVLREAVSRDKYLHESDGRLFTRGIEEWIPRVNKWKRVGYVATDYDSHIIADLIIGIINLGDTLITQDPRKESKIIDNMTRFLVRALSPTKVNASGTPMKLKKVE